MLLHEFFNHLAKDFPELHQTLNLCDLVKFTALAAEVTARAKGTPGFRHEPDSIVPFLQTALDISLSDQLFYQLWDAISPVLPDLRVQPASLIQQHGYSSSLTLKIPEFFFVAPVKNCLACDSAPKLHHRSQIDGYLYGLDGVHTAEIITLKCPDCATYYRPSYYSHKGLRTYYSALNGRNQYAFQVSCHFFMTHQLAEFFLEGQMLAHISNFNKVNLFNVSHVDGVLLPTLSAAPSVQPALSEETCRDALDIHALLLRADSRHSVLRVDTSALMELRYHPAMQLVLECIALEGSKHRNHACSACVRVVPISSDDGSPKLGYIRAVVTDGITIGHWRCTATTEQLREIAQKNGSNIPNGPCTAPLAKVNDRFCPEHHKLLGTRCYAQPCVNNALPGTATCGLEAHVVAYNKFKARGSSNFALTSMLNQPGSSQPSDTTVHQHWNTAELIGLEEVQEVDESDRPHEQAREGADAAPANRVHLSRSKTHNEQNYYIDINI